MPSATRKLYDCCVHISVAFVSCMHVSSSVGAGDLGCSCSGLKVTSPDLLTLLNAALILKATKS